MSGEIETLTHDPAAQTLRLPLIVSGEIETAEAVAVIFVVLQTLNRVW